MRPEYGVPREVTPYASVLLAPNPSVMTLEGTNTWLVRAPGAEDAVVIDPGPADSRHLRTLAERGPITHIVLTHHHPDHVAGAWELAESTGASVTAADPGLCAGTGPLQEGQNLSAAGLDLRILATPGHTSDSLCLATRYAGVAAVFTGDTILGRGTTVVAYPDGDLGAYLGSVRRLADFPRGTWALPGHGPELGDVAETAQAYLEHRHQRLEQVRAAVQEQGIRVTPRQVVERVYSDVAAKSAAESTVRAQLAYLRRLGEL